MSALSQVKAFCNVTEPDWIIPFFETTSANDFDPTITNAGSLLAIWWLGNGEFRTGNAVDYNYGYAGTKLPLIQPGIAGNITALDAQSDNVTYANVYGLTECATIALQNNAMIQPGVDTVLFEIYAYRASFTAVAPAIDISGTNAAPTGNYAAPPAPGVSNSDWAWDGAGHQPLTGKAAAYALVNDPNGDGFNTWTVTFTP